MKARAAVALLAALLAGAGLGADLSAALAEPNLEKRSRKALENAERALQAARQAYQRGDLEAVRAGLAELQESVELADRSLKQTGKNPVRSPKHFKHAEIKTRELLRRLGHFRDRMSFEDRPLIEPVRQALQAIHEDLLLGIMGKKKGR